MHLGAETRIRVIINDILPNIKKRMKLGFYLNEDYLFNLQEKAMELSEHTRNPLSYSIIIRESFNRMYEE